MLHRTIFISALRCLKSTARKLQTSSHLRSSFTLAHSPNAKLNKAIVDRYMCLPLPDCVSVVKYVWIDGTGDNLRSKTRTLEYFPECHKEVPNWDFDGSATYQANDKNSDIQLIPVRMYHDPFRRGKNKLVLCETYKPDGKPTSTNFRAKCMESMGKVCEHEDMWGLEQEFHLMDMDGRPFGWPVMLGEPKRTRNHFCGVGATKVYGREIIEAHYRACLYAGVHIGGVNADAVLGQWEYLIGPCQGIKAADDLWMARFILERVAEDFGVAISRAPKLLPEWKGAACHVNFSTKSMREDNGISKIKEAAEKLAARHKDHLAVYDPCCGEENRKRLTGSDETSCADAFSVGSERNVSVRIASEVQAMKKGHLEDRRPGANMDPYRLAFHNKILDRVMPRDIFSKSNDFFMNKWTNKFIDFLDRVKATVKYEI